MSQATITYHDLPAVSKEYSYWSPPLYAYYSPGEDTSFSNEPLSISLPAITEVVTKSSPVFEGEVSYTKVSSNC